MSETMQDRDMGWDGYAKLRKQVRLDFDFDLGIFGIFGKSYREVRSTFSF